jgi:hypothetical protein
MLYQVISVYVNLGQFSPGYVTLRQVKSGYYRLGMVIQVRSV